MNILVITAGAANMYCGSCLRDNALAAELLRQGHDVTLLPIYTPTRTDEPNVSESRTLYGGINVYLQQTVPLFRHTPAFLDKLFDSRFIMRLVSKLSVSTDPAKLGGLTISTLKGEDGFQQKEVKKLVAWLAAQSPPDVIVLPNSLMIGFARPLKKALGRPVACTLQGEDLFLDGLPSRDREEAVRMIREQVKDVDVFMAVSDYYARFMSELLEIPDEKMTVVPLGINLRGYQGAETSPVGPLKIGYFARVAPEKGLHNLCEAYRLLRQRSDLPETRLEIAGYLGREHRGYLDAQMRAMQQAGLASEVRYHGVLDRQQKIDFLRSLALVSVPTDYEEPKGIFLLEAMACGVPVVQPDRGAFGEMLALTGGGRLARAGDAAHLAEVLAELLLDTEARRKLGRRARAGVERHYSVERMARISLEVFEPLARGEGVPKFEAAKAAGA